MGLRPNILMLMWGVFGFTLMACSKLQVSKEAPPIAFKGLTSVESTARGSLILRWDQPENIPVAGFEVFRQELATPASLHGFGPKKKSIAPHLLSEEDPSVGSIATVIQDLPDAEAPVTKGRLLQVVAGDLNSFEAVGLVPGQYGFQVRAVSSDGRTDTNTRVILMSLESDMAYPGLAKAELVGTDLFLEWPPLATSLNGQSVNYTVYEGPTFNKAVAITTDTRAQLSVRGARPGSTLSYGVRSTDPKGRMDRNTKVLTVTIPEETTTFAGCVKGEARGADRVRITFAWPEEEFESFQIFRNGTQVFATRDKGVTSFVDVGLIEGETYKYSCAVTYKDLVLAGSNLLTVGTLTSNPPTFKGIRAVEVLSAHIAKVRWGVSTGVPTHHFNVYANIGTKVDWQREPVKTVSGDTLDLELTDLGDELSYAFGVRACSIKDVCDSNELSLVASTPDDGPPRTPGVASLAIREGKLVIRAPWNGALGGVSKRFVYMKADGEPTLDLSTYVNALTIPVADPSAVPTELVYSGISDNTVYHVIVRDQDGRGQMTPATTPVSINSGDTTPPVFPGLMSLGTGPENQKETSLTVRFRALSPETATSKYGVWEYLAYVVTGATGACAATSIHQIFPASSFTANQDSELVVTGLQARTLYNVCLKARDKAGNISATTLAAARSTLDGTAPAFDGVQSVTFNKEKGELSLTWTPSPASDIYEYDVKVWKSNADPTQVPVTALRFSASAAASGVSLSRTTVSLDSNEDVYVLVNACDNAGLVSGGSQNCSTLTTPSLLALPDIEPPPGFLGIAAAPQLTTPSEGTVVVSWITPSDWSDYKGFKVYLVQPDTNTLASSPVWDCPCSAVGCPTPVTSCNITGLDTFRTYVFHVRAYDQVGNTTQLDPLTYSTAKRTSDTSAPTFSSALSATYDSGRTVLTWSTATDNQYPAEPGATISYEVWRKTGSTFDNPMSPNAVDANLMATIPDITWTDPGDDFAGGVTYFYTVCAKDGTGNRRCDGNVRTITTPDLVVPVIGSFTSDKAGDSDWSWNLNWTMSDNATATNQLFVRIYVKYSNLAEDQATTSHSQILAQAGVTEKTNVKGPVNTNTYVHYLLEVRDNDGNKATRSLTLRSNNLVTLSKVRSDEGPLAGGKRLVVVGDGFKPDATVTIGSSDCTSLVVISRKHLLCTVPPAAQTESVSVTVTNPDGSSATLANAYRYCEPTTAGSCENICNRPSAWGSPFAAGTGLTEQSPFVICNASHLNSIRNQPYNRFYALGENIDLQGITFEPIKNAGQWDFRGTLDGDNYTISNWTYTNITQDGVGLFRILNFSKIKDLGLLQFQVSGRSFVGSLAGGTSVNNEFGGPFYQEYVSIEGVYTTGSVEGVDVDVGGVVGRFYGIDAANMMSFANVTGGRVVGGLFGRKIYGGSHLEYSGTVLAKGVNSDCYAGGVAGHWDASTFTLSQLSSSGTVRCRDDSSQVANYTGGVIGRLESATVDSISSSATVNGENVVGGVIGYMVNTTVTNGTFQGSVEGSRNVGGLIGQMQSVSKMTTCTNNGVVTGRAPLKKPSESPWTAGGVVGYMEGTSTSQPALIKNCVNSKPVSGKIYIGGLVGAGLDFQVEASSSTGDILATGTDARAGGAIGQARRGNLVDSYATGNVTALTGNNVGGFLGFTWEDVGPSILLRVRASGAVIGRSVVGGLAGRMRGTVTDSSASGKVTGNEHVGGLVGHVPLGAVDAMNRIEGSKASGVVEGGTHCGGLIGSIRGHSQVTRTAATGSVTCPTYAGGLIGTFYGELSDINVSISQSMSRGNVAGNTNIGGFIGVANRNNSHQVAVDNSYARGNVKGNTNVGGFAGSIGDVVTRVYASGKVEKDSAELNLGGLIGNLWSPDGPRDAQFSYWDKDASGRTTSAAGIGKTTQEMRGSSLYGGDWDTAIWRFDPTDYPRLLWETTP